VAAKKDFGFELRWLAGIKIGGVHGSASLRGRNAQTLTKLAWAQEREYNRIVSC
jgi:hypothetical protein